METREGYKKTELGWIPEDWKLTALGHKEITLKITQGPNPKYNIGKPVSLYRALKTKDLYNNEIKYSNADKISYETFLGCKNSELKNKDILIAIVGRGSIGKSNMFLEKEGAHFIYTRALGLVRVNDRVLLPDFINHYFQSYKAKKYFDRGIGGSTGQEVLQTSTLKTMPILIPPLPEQQKIAEILTTVDNKISSIEDRIKQTEQLKKGLMEKLLTEGIGHTEFKDTEIGQIPKEWDVVSIADAGIDVIDGDRGTNYPKQDDFTDSGYCLFLTAKNVSKMGFRFDEKQFISKEKDLLLRKGKLNRNDIVITTRGTVGNISWYNDAVSYENIRINSGMALIRQIKKNYDFSYLYILLRSEAFQKQINLIAFGSAQPQLTIKEIKKFRIVTPTLPEQKQIASILNSVGDKLDILQSKKTSYEILKKGLMEQLLTGKRRVTLSS